MDLAGGRTVSLQRSDRRLILAFIEVRQFDKMAWLCGGDSQGGDSHAVLLAKGNGFRGVGAER